jgi:hypothetical protein
MPQTAILYSKTTRSFSSSTEIIIGSEFPEIIKTKYQVLSLKTHKLPYRSQQSSDGF